LRNINLAPLFDGMSAEAIDAILEG
jgi:hypothetical protein